MSDMEENSTEWGSLKVPSSELQLKNLLSCGQSFRWKVTEDTQPQEWTGVFAHHIWILKQEGNTLFYKVYPKNGDNPPTQHHCIHLLQEYFQLDVPLTKLYQEWARIDTKFAKLLELEHCAGIRILKQNPIETIFAFICSANNNISRITQMVEKLCTFYGEKITDLNGKVYYDFPLVEKLQGSEVEINLRAEAFGYRAEYIRRSAELIVAKGDITWVNELKKIGYEGARKELQTLIGVGRKVADCVCLMGLGYHEAIPVDTHIYKLGKEYIPQLKETKTVTDKVYTEITDFFRTLHGQYAGWAQSILFTSSIRTEESAWFEENGKKRKKDCSELIQKIKRLKST